MQSKILCILLLLGTANPVEFNTEIRDRSGKWQQVATRIDTDLWLIRDDVEIQENSLLQWQGGKGVIINAYCGGKKGENWIVRIKELP